MAEHFNLENIFKNEQVQFYGYVHEELMVIFSCVEINPFETRRMG